MTNNGVCNSPPIKGHRTDPEFFLGYSVFGPGVWPNKNRPIIIGPLLFCKTRLAFTPVKLVLLGIFLLFCLSTSQCIIKSGPVKATRDWLVMGELNCLYWVLQACTGYFSHKQNRPANRGGRLRMNKKHNNKPFSCMGRSLMTG
jgi:hypothetical protein